MRKIRIIKNKDIDPILWDRCIARAQNGNVFGYSWFLDSVSSKWSGIVLGNYKAVMPLSVHNFPGFTYVKNFQFQLYTNIYAHDEISAEIKKEIFLLAKKFTKRIYFTSEDKLLSLKSSKLKTCYAWKLDLIRPYKEVNLNYNEFIIKQLNNSEANKVFFNTGILPNGITLLSALTKTLRKKDIDTLRRLSAVSLRKNLGQIYGAFNEHNRLIAAVLFISSHYKVNIIHAVQTKEAENKKALYGLIDHYIKQHSEKALTLDFFGMQHFPEDFFINLSAVKYPWYKIKL